MKMRFAIIAIFALLRTQPLRAATPPNLTARIERGRVLLGLGDARAQTILRDAARDSLSALREYSEAATTDSEWTPKTAQRGAWRRARLDALAAHRWLMEAQNQARETNAAIASGALLLALSEADVSASLSTQGSRIEEEKARTLLFQLLPDGLPARTDFVTLRRLARHFFRAPMEEASAEKRLLINTPIAAAGAPKSFLSPRVPPIYSAFSNLPPALHMDRSVGAYQSTSDGTWQLAARVFYASPSRTLKARDDAPRARWLAQQTLRVAAWQNQWWRIARPETVTLWLCESDAHWPRSSAAPDAKILSDAKIFSDAESFLAGGWIERVPQHIFLFRADVPRSDFGWMRQLSHEYSHMTWPRFAGYAPPLEPLGNGLLGETCTMLKLATLDPDARWRAAHQAYFKNVVRPALDLWKTRGPQFSPRAGTPDDLQITQGLAAFLVNSGNDEWLARALEKMRTREYSAKEKTAAFHSFRNCAEEAARDLFLDNSRLQWSFSELNAAGATPWIYLPTGARSLEIKWRAPEKMPLRFRLSGKEYALNASNFKDAEYSARLAFPARGNWEKLEVLSRQNAEIVSLSALR